MNVRETTDPHALVTRLAERMLPGLVLGGEAHIQLTFESDDDDFCLHWRADGWDHLPGRVADPYVELFFPDLATAADITLGRRSGLDAFMSGDIRASGHIVLSVVITQLFDPTIPLD